MPDPGLTASGRNKGNAYYARGATNVMNYESKSAFLRLQDEAPELDPGTAWQLASSGMPTAEMLGAAWSAIGVGGMKSSAAELAALPEEIQRSKWASMSSERQKLLIEQGGYTPADVKAKRSESWWQTGLLAAPRALEWAYDKSSLDRVVDRVGVDDVTNWTMDKLTNLGDDAAGRPYRAAIDASGQQRAARMDMTLAQARQEMEAQGFSMNEDQWNYLNWKYLERNKLEVTYVGDKNNDPGAGTAAQHVLGGVPVFGGAVRLATSVPGLQDLPWIKPATDRIGQRYETYNPYESASGAIAPDSVFQQFEDKVNLLKERPDYSMSPWATWNRVDNGRTYVTPLHQKWAREQLGGRDSEALDLAVWESQGRGIEEFVTETMNITPDDPRFDVEASRLAQTYLPDPTYQSVVTQLSRDQSKISFGRDYARALGIPDDTALFTVASGVADATHISAMDPMLALGKATKLARVARLGTTLEGIADTRRAWNSVKAGEGVWKMAEHTDEVAQLTDATRALRNPGLADLLEEAPFDKVDDLIDAQGHATPWLVENFNDVKTFVDKAVVRAETGPKWDPGELDALDLIQDSLSRAVPVLANPDMGGIKGAVTKWQAARTGAWAERVAEGFTEFEKVGGAGLDQLVKDVPYILPGLPGLQEWHAAQRAIGKAGLTTSDGVFDALMQMGPEFGLGSGLLNGSSVRGFGNGVVNVPERWRLWGSAAEDVPRVSRAREELLMLPELSKSSQAWRRTMNAGEEAIGRWKEGTFTTPVGEVAGYVPGIKKFRTAAGSLTYQLTHQITRKPAVDLFDLVELRKVRDMGRVMGMSAEEGDAFFSRILGGLEVDDTIRVLGNDADRIDATDLLWKFSNDQVARTDSLRAVDGLVETGAITKARAAGMRATIDEGYQDEVFQAFTSRFAGEELPEIINADGVASDWFKGNFEEVLAWRDDMLKAQPHLANHAVMQALGRTARAGTVSTGATRIALLKGYLGAAMERAGVHATKEGKQWSDNFLGKLRTGAYSGNDLDLFQMGSEVYRQGMLPLAHHSDWMAVPDFAQLQRSATDISHIQRFFNKINGPMVDALMAKGWKPITLMRLGFIPRAVGEEALAFFAGRGIYAMEGYLASWATNDKNLWPIQGVRRVLRAPARKWGELYGIENADELWNMVNVLPYLSVRSYLDDMAVTHLGRDASQLRRLDRLTLAADYMAAKATARLKRVEFAMLPEQMKRSALVTAGAKGRTDLALALDMPATYERYTRGIADDARQLLRNGEMVQRAYAQEMAGLGQRAWYSTDEAWGPHEQIAVRMNPYASEDVATLQVRVGRDWVPLDTAEKLDHATAIQVAYALNQRAVDPVAMAGIEAGLAGRITQENLLDVLAGPLGEPVFAPTIGDLTVNAADAATAASRYEQLTNVELALVWKQAPIDSDLVGEIRRRLDDDRIDPTQFVPDDTYDVMPDMPLPPGRDTPITADMVLRDALDIAAEDADALAGRSALYDAANPRRRPGLYDDFDEYDPVDRQLESIRSRAMEEEVPMASPQFLGLEGSQRGGDVDALLADFRERHPNLDVSAEDPDFLYRGVNNDDQWYVDEDGALHFRANVSGRNAGDSVSTSRAPDFSIDWSHRPMDLGEEFQDSPIVFRLRSSAADEGGLVRGEGYDPAEVELVAEGGETVIPAGEWTAWGYDNTDEIVQHSPQLTRQALVEELEAIATGALRPQESQYWRSQADEGVQKLVRDVQDRGSVRIESETPETAWGYRGTATRADAERVLAKAEQLRQRINNWKPADLRNLRAHFAAEHPTGPAFRGKYGPKLAKHEGLLAQLPPGLRELAENTDPRAPIQEVLASALDRAARGDGQMLEDLAIVAGDKLGTGTRLSQVLTGPNELRIADRGADLEEMRAAIYAQLQSAEMAPYVRANVRSMMVDGVPVRLRPTDQKRIYSVMADKETASTITRMRMAGRDQEVMNGLRAAGMTDEQAPIVATILREWDTQAVEAQINAALMAKQGTMVPLGRVSFDSYDQADEIAGLFARWKPAAGDYARQHVGTTYSDAGKAVSVGYADTRHADSPGFGGGGEWRQANGGLYNLDDTTLYQMRPYSDLPQTRFDDYGVPDPKGRHVAEGMEAEEALKRWADVLTDDLEATYFTPRGDVLHELVVPSVTGEFGVSSVRAVPQADLPTNLYAPQTYAVPTNWWAKAVNYGFGHVINPAIFAGIRHPRFSLEFSDALAGTREVVRHMRNPAVDSGIAELIVGKGGTIEDIRSAWHAIPHEARRAIGDGESMRDAMREAVRADQLDETHLLFDLDDDVLGQVARWARRDQHVEEVATRSALNRAMDSLVPYIDDHEVRSFFQVTARNIMPFQFAQEQFYKRWLNTFRYSPEALRRAQLISHGFTSSGFVREDEYGNRAFVIPASEAFGQVLANVPLVSAVFGKAAAVPLSVPLTSDVKTMLPGVPGDVGKLPSLSPVAMVPARMVTGLFPEARPVVSMFNGGMTINDVEANPTSLSAAIIDQFVPKNYQRAYGAIFGGGTEFIEAELNRSSIGAMQMMEAEAIRLRAEADVLAASGEGEKAEDLLARAEDLSPGDGATEIQMEAYLDKVRDWARANMMTRAVIGFVGPNAPRNEFEGMELSKEFTDMLDYMDFDEALGVFLAEHPNARPWTVFDTTKETKAPIARTDESLKWLDDNAEYLQAFPKAGPWLMPQSSSSDEYSQQAYTQEVAAGLRSRKTPEEWYRAAKWASAANVYFPTKARTDAALLNADAETKKVITAQWEAWSAGFKNQHPLFASELNGAKGAETDETLAELRLALVDPSGPDAPHKTEMLTMVDSYFRYDRERSLLSGDNSTKGRERKKLMDKQFLDWGWGYVAQFPTVRSLWTSLIVPASDLRSLDQARLVTSGGR